MVKIENKKVEQIKVPDPEEVRVEEGAPIQKESFQWDRLFVPLLIVAMVAVVTAFAIVRVNKVKSKLPASTVTYNKFMLTQKPEYQSNYITIKSQFLPALAELSKTFDIDQDIMFALAYSQSRFDNTTNNSDSIGLYKVSLKVWGKPLNMTKDELQDVRNNTRASAQILKYYLKGKDYKNCLYLYLGKNPAKFSSEPAKFKSERLDSLFEILSIYGQILQIKKDDK